MTDRLRRRSQGSPRTDDSTTITKRLETYYRASIPVMAYYETKTQLRKVKCFTFLLQIKPIIPPLFLREKKKMGNFWLRGLGIRAA